MTMLDESPDDKMTPRWGMRKQPLASLDDYPTPPWATRALLNWLEAAGGGMEGNLAKKTAWEPTANRGHMARTLEERFGSVHKSDIEDYGAGYEVRDFLFPDNRDEPVDWIVCNPPYTLAQEFVPPMLNRSTCGAAMLCRLQWLEGTERHDRIFSKHPPSDVLVFSERLSFAKGKVGKTTVGGGAMSFAWFVWGHNYLCNAPSLHWLGTGTRKRCEKEGDYDEAR